MEESLSKVNNSNVDFPLLRVYTKDTNYRQNDKGHADHLHLPSGFLRMCGAKFGLVQVTDAMPHRFTWLSSLA